MGNKPVNGMNLDVNETIRETINSDGFHFRYWFYHKMKPEYKMASKFILFSRGGQTRTGGP